MKRDVVLDVAFKADLIPEPTASTRRSYDRHLRNLRKDPGDLKGCGPLALEAHAVARTQAGPGRPGWIPHLQQFWSQILDALRAHQKEQDALTKDS